MVVGKSEQLVAAPAMRKMRACKQIAVPGRHG